MSCMAARSFIAWNTSERAVETRTVRDEDILSNTGFSIYAGTEVTGWPVTVLRRGEVVYTEGRVTARRGSGKVIARSRIERPTGR